MKERQPSQFLPGSPMGMGSCFGNCFKKDSRSPCTVYFSGTDVVEFDNLVDSMETVGGEPRRSRFHGLSALLSLRRAQRAPTQRLFLEMTETRHRSTNPHCLLQTSTESLQVLDARVLASKAACQLPPTRPSTPGSFLDLDWELEGVSRVEARTSPTESLVGSVGHQASTTQCSRVSSPPSLEWDLVDCQLSSPCPDDDTEQLIHEIERLTQQALQETGFTLQYNNHV